MSQYQELDSRILSAIKAGHNPLYFHLVAEEAGRLATATGREDFRVIDGRLQALRKANKIEFLHKRQAAARGVPAGWAVVQEILPVSVYSKDTDGSWVVFCPHCKRVLGLEPGPIRGEQFQDRVCGGWLEVTHDAKRVLDLQAGV